MFLLSFLFWTFCFSQNDLKLLYDLRDQLELDIDRFSEGYAVFHKDKKAGIIDSTGTVTLEPVSGSISTFSKGVFIHYLDTKNSRKVGLMDAFGKYTIPLDYYDFGLNWNRKNQFLIVSKDKKFALLNYSDGSHFLDFIYDEITYAHQDMFFVKKDSKWAIYNGKKGFVSDFIYTENSYFVKEKACVRLGQNIYQIVDTENKTLLKSKHELINLDRSDTYFVTLDRHLNKEGLIDEQGQEILPLSYSSIYISGDYAILKRDKKQFIFNIKAKNLTEVKGNFVNFLFDKYFEIGIDNKTFIIDEFGNKILNDALDNVIVVNTDNDRFIVIERNKQFNILNSKFETLFPKDFTIFIFDKKQLIAKKDDGFQRIDWGTWQSVLLDFDEIKSNNFYYAFIDRIIDNQGFLAVKNKKYGFVKIDGSVILPFDYEEIINFRNYTSFVVKKNGKYGIVNAKNEIVRPIEYDSYGFSKEYMYLMKGGKKEIIPTY